MKTSGTGIALEEEGGRMTSAKPAAAMIADLMVAHGVRMVFASPGSRNAPLLVAMSRCGGLGVEMVVDERSAAYMAIGYAATSGEPVAVVCTSGTALLNYLPAVAEAYYRRIPLIVVSADRPEAWIDQDDSQTLHQPGTLEPYVKASCDIPDVDAADSTGMWWINRSLNDALCAACLRRKGPVHINLRFDAPLDRCAPMGEAPRRIEVVAPAPVMTTAEARALGREVASPRKVLVVAGFMSPSQKVTRAVSRLAALPNVAVLAENLANLHCPGAIGQIDSVLASLSADRRKEMRPDVVISFGGALVSRQLKSFLREARPAEHWHVGLTDTTIDCFCSLTRRVEIAPEQFLPQFASAMQPHRAPADYAAMWHEAASAAAQGHAGFVSRAPWSALKAIDTIAAMIPSRWNVQVSNGTSIRYLQLADSSRLHRVDCNRGVSGIDGSTSTAVGAQLAYRFDDTLLLTGDMSLQYDLTALGTTQVSPRMKVIVMNNGGGGIFRFIPSTSALPELDSCFVARKPFPVASLARAWGWSVAEASDMESLRDGLAMLMKPAIMPSMLIVNTDSRVDTEILNRYFNDLKNIYGKERVDHHQGIHRHPVSETWSHSQDHHQPSSGLQRLPSADQQGDA